MTPEEEKQLIRELENSGPEMVRRLLWDRHSTWRGAEKQQVVQAWLAKKDRDHFNAVNRTPINISKWALGISLLSFLGAFASLLVTIYCGDG